jgi:hypothetical protein
MRYLFGFICVLALGVMPLVGCSESGGAGGTGGDGGTGGTDLCEDVTCEDTECKIDGVCDASDGMCDYTSVADGTACSNGECLDGVCAPVGAFSCTEQGIRAAIAAGGGPHFFACDGPQTVATAEEIIIDTDVILDGEGRLTVDGDDNHRVFGVSDGVTTELHRLTVSGGLGGNGPGGFSNPGGTVRLTGVTVSDNGCTGGAVLPCESGSGIWNGGTMTLKDTTVSENRAGGISNDGTMTITNSTVSGNSTDGTGGGILNGGGEMTVTNSTVSGNVAVEGFGGIVNSEATLSITSSTIWTNTSWLDTPEEVSGGILNEGGGTVTVANSFVDGVCVGDIVSGGYNIETPGDTCGFEVRVGSPKVGLLGDHGGPTATHALLTDPDSVAIDMVPGSECEVDEDQRGVRRPQGDECDVGAFELEHCASAADCNDDNDCTEDVCRPEGLCRNTPADDGTVCDDAGTPGECVGDSCVPM